MNKCIINAIFECFDLIAGEEKNINQYFKNSYQQNLGHHSRLIFSENFIEVPLYRIIVKYLLSYIDDVKNNFFYSIFQNFQT